MAYHLAHDVFNDIFRDEGLTYEDFLVKPADIISFYINGVDIKTKLTKNISLELGIVGSPMDTVMNLEIGIALALMGGIGCFHFNYGDGVEGIKKVVELINKLKSYKLDPEDFPNATVDEDGRLRVLAAVESYDSALPKVDAYVEAGIDGIIIDTSMNSTLELELIGKIKEKYPELDIITGNYCTEDQINLIINHFGEHAKDILDCFRIGVGPGQTCDLQMNLGTGRPNASSVYFCAKAIHDFGGHAMADGGIYNSGAVFKAMAIGAHTVMLGTWLGSTKEAPGREDEEGNKEISGMGSEEAMERGGDKRYQKKRVTQGQTGRVKIVSSVYKFLEDRDTYLKQAFAYNGVKNIEELHFRLYGEKDIQNEDPQMFEKLSSNARIATGPYGMLKV